MKAKLEAKGYKVVLQYANNDVNTQVQQLENMITQGCKVLVIASIDGSVLSDVLKQAKESDIKVIAYDRLIMNTPDVDYYATFDNFKVGVIQGQYIEKALGLKEGKGPYNLELFAGSPDDNNAVFFFNGAMPMRISSPAVRPTSSLKRPKSSTSRMSTETGVGSSRARERAFSSSIMK